MNITNEGLQSINWAEVEIMLKKPIYLQPPPAQMFGLDEPSTVEGYVKFEFYLSDKFSTELIQAEKQVRQIIREIFLRTGQPEPSKLFKLLQSIFN
jgi:hypothetical protein